MLLLVLILVVIAFGLLVVALLSTSVLWAWVSVGVSVVAAAVLLVDYLQRRSAAKAGAMPAMEQATAPDHGSGRSATAAPPRGDLDPATEVLPIVASSARGGSDADSPTVMASAPPQFDAQQTVVMPAVQPSGSPALPSGADPSVTPSSPVSSPSVTKAEVDRSGSDSDTGDRTTSVEPASIPDTTPPGTEPEDVDEPAAGSAPDPEAVAPSEPTAKVALGKAAAGAAPTKPDGPDEAETSPPGESAVVPAASGTAASGTGVPQPAVATADPDVESTVAVEAHPSTPDAPLSATDVAPVDATRDNAVSAPAEQVDLFAAPAAAPVEPASSADAPEAPRDPIAAEIVSGLDDEVVVVDEQPRYHVSECRALVSVAVIPLPVREAVELGFTPCGWCSPERTLAGRHQTASR